MQIFVFNLLEKKLRKLNVMKIQNQIFPGYKHITRKCIDNFALDLLPLC